MFNSGLGLTFCESCPAIHQPPWAQMQLQHQRFSRVGITLPPRVGRPQLVERAVVGTVAQGIRGSKLPLYPQEDGRNLAN